MREPLWRRALRSGSATLVLAQLARLTVQITALIVLSQVLPPAAFGLVAMVTAVAGIATVIGDFGLSLAALTGGPLDQNQRSKLFLTNAGVGFFLTGAVAASGPALVAFYGRDELAAIAAGISPIFLLNALAVQFKVELNLRSRWARLALTETAGPVLGLACAIPVAAVTHSYWALVMQPVIASAVQLVLAVGLAAWHPSRTNRSSSISTHLRFGRDTLGLQAFTYVSSNTDNAVVGRSMGEDVLGEYSRAYQLAMMPVTQLASPLTRVMLPRLRDARDVESFNATGAALQRILCYSLFAPLTFLIATARPLTELALGENWSAVPPLLQILSLGSMFVAAAYVYYWMYLARQATKVLALTEGIARLAMVGAVIAAGAKGPLWVAWSVTGGQVLLMVASSVVGWRVLQFDVPRLLKGALGPTLALGSGAVAGVWAQGWTSDSSSLESLALCALAWIVASTAVATAVTPIRSELAGYARAATSFVRDR